MKLEIIDTDYDGAFKLGSEWDGNPYAIDQNISYPGGVEFSDPSHIRGARDALNILAQFKFQNKNPD